MNDCIVFLWLVIVITSSSIALVASSWPGEISAGEGFDLPSPLLLEALWGFLSPLDKLRDYCAF